MLAYSCDVKNQTVEEFSKNICMHIAATDPKSLKIETLDQNLVDKEKSIFFEQLKSSNKPENIIEKIVDGKVRKFYEEVCLMEQTFVVDNKTKIKDNIILFNKTNGLNFEIKDFVTFKLGQE